VSGTARPSGARPTARGQAGRRIIATTPWRRVAEQRKQSGTLCALSQRVSRRPIGGDRLIGRGPARGQPDEKTGTPVAHPHSARRSRAGVEDHDIATRPRFPTRPSSAVWLEWLPSSSQTRRRSPPFRTGSCRCCSVLGRSQGPETCPAKGGHGCRAVADQQGNESKLMVRFRGVAVQPQCRQLLFPRLVESTHPSEFHAPLVVFVEPSTNIVVRHCGVPRSTGACGSTSNFRRMLDQGHRVVNSGRSRFKRPERARKDPDCRPSSSPAHRRSTPRHWDAVRERGTRR